MKAWGGRRGEVQRINMDTKQEPQKCTNGHRGQSGRGVKLTIHLQLVPRLRMHGTMPSLPQYVFMAWRLIKHRIHVEVFWVMTSSSDVIGYQGAMQPPPWRWRQHGCPITSLHSVITQGATTWNVTAKTSRTRLSKTSFLRGTGLSTLSLKAEE
jgi:hypothetical protein